jgi:phenylacetate-CoA ligase
MKIYSLETLVNTARERSPFYGEWYAQVPRTGWQLADLPIVDQVAFWAANTMRDNRVLTGPMRGGIIFKSGGTTGAPKFSPYTKEEWDSFTQAFGQGMAANALEAGDRVADLFYAGQLYASFLFITYSLQWCPVDVLQLPISGAADFEFMAHTCEDFDINVLAGVPTTIIGLAEYMHEQKRRNTKIERIVFGGENMYDDQREFLAGVFPNAVVRSIGYASVDAGLLGYCDRTCGPTEHRCFGEHTIVEIVDEESGQPIEEAGRPGKIVVTNLTRLLMPIIRYPAGDRIAWTELPGARDRKFAILGRSEEGARVGPMTLYAEDVRGVLHGFHDRLEYSDFQLLVTHEAKLDRCTLCIACELAEGERPALAEEVRQAVYEARPMFADLLKQNLVHPLEVQLVHHDELVINPRTGKLRRIIDQRLEGTDEPKP